ncbi:MAG: hypothetical protein RLZZ522_1819 [Verrucomicrobiota bacterium]|jgi:hypothetical protein
MRHLLSLLPVFFVLSCAADKKVDPSASTEPKTMSQRFSGDPIKQDANGQWPVDTKKEYAMAANKQSPFVTSESTQPKTYQTGEYAKTSWWGKSAYQTQPYSGKKDATQYQKPARDQGAAAHEAGTAAAVPGRYQTGEFRTGSAHEAGAKPVAKPSTVDSGRAYPEQDVMGWKQMRELDVKATKSILGRE